MKDGGKNVNGYFNSVVFCMHGTIHELLSLSTKFIYYTHWVKVGKAIIFDQGHVCK